jgi:hypothetical protein
MRRSPIIGYRRAREPTRSKQDACRQLAPKKHSVRVAFIRERPNTAYVFLVLAPDPTRPREEYERARNNILAATTSRMNIGLRRGGFQAELNILVNFRERVLVAQETEYLDGAPT